MKIKRIVVALLALSALTYAEDSKFSFALRGGYYLPFTSTFNDDYLPAINQNFNELDSYFKSLDFTSTVTQMKKLNGGAVFGGEFEIFASEQFSIVFGAEYWSKKTTGTIDAEGTIDEVSYQISEGSLTKASVIPIVATIRINLPFKNFRAYIGGGVGYYLGKVKVEDSWSWIEGSETVDSGTREIKSSGSSFVPHANIGVDLNLTGSITLAADIRYPFGSINSFKIKSDTEDEGMIGQKLTFTDINGVEKDFKLELSGPSLGIKLKILF